MPICLGFKRPHPVSQSVSLGLRHDSDRERVTLESCGLHGFRSLFINEVDFNPCERPASHHSPRGIHLSLLPLILAFVVVFGYFLSSKFPEVFHGCFCERTYYEIRLRLFTNNAIHTPSFAFFQIQPTG